MCVYYFNIGRPVVFSAKEIDVNKSYRYCPNPDDTEYELQRFTYIRKVRILCEKYVMYCYVRNCCISIM